MGTITYDHWSIDFEDRLLSHLHLVIMKLFRNQESFAMSWLEALETGNGRSSIWLHPDGDIHFHFLGSRVPHINEEWVRTLTKSAHSSKGLVVTAEDGTLARSSGARSASTGRGRPAT